MLKKYAFQAGLDERLISPHFLRHAFASRYLTTNPGDLRGLAAILGYSNLNTVLIYTEAKCSRSCQSHEEGRDRERVSGVRAAFLQKRQLGRRSDVCNLIWLALAAMSDPVAGRLSVPFHVFSQLAQFALLSGVENLLALIR